MKRYGIRLLLIILLQTVYNYSEARDFYWIGGSGNFNDIQHWSDQPGGKVNPDALLPDKDDNVFFDEHSFPNANPEVVITSVARCANMHWGNVKNMPVFKTDNNPAHYLVIYGGVVFTNQMILDLDRPLYFRASTQGNIIDFGGNTFDGDLIFENNGGWRITGDLDILDNQIQFQQGSLSIEAEIKCGGIESQTAISRELYLNSSIINLNNPGGSVLSLQTDNLRIHPDYSTINILSDNSSIELSGFQMADFNNVVFNGNSGVIQNSALRANFNKLTFHKDGSLSGYNYFQELIFTQGHSYNLVDGSQNVNVLFSAKGECYAYINITGGSGGDFISAEDVDLSFLKVRNITASGTAMPFTANDSYDLGANTGWNFIPPNSDVYTWTGAGGNNNWGNHLNWDKGCVPSRNNNAIIPDGYSVNIDIQAECKDLEVMGTSTMLGTNRLEIYASLKAKGATWSFTGETYFKGSGTIALDATMTGSVFINATGTYTLASNFTTTNVLSLNSGNLTAATFTINVDRFVSNTTDPRTLNITNSKLNVNAGTLKAWHVEGSGFNFDGVGSQITLLQSGAEFYNNSDGITYEKVLFHPQDNQVFLTNVNASDFPTFNELIFNGSAKISGNHQYYNLILAEGKEYLFQAGSTQKILGNNGFNAIGSCSKNIILKGDGGIAFLDCDVNSTNIFRVRIEDFNVTGSLAGTLKANESIGVSGYDGWVFPDDLTGENIYWTGKKNGDWFEAENWSTNCIPTRKDNVFFEDAMVEGFFDVNISLKGNVAECNDMIWKSSALMSFSGERKINIFGSLDMSGLSVGNNSYSGDINFKSEEAQTVNIGSDQLISKLNFVGNKQDDGSWKAGPWTITSDLKTIGTINLERGTLSTNNNNIKAKEFYSNYGADNIRELNLGSSVLTLERFEVSAEKFSLLAGTSEIKITKADEFIVSKGSEALIFNNLSFEEATGISYVDIHADNVSFNDLIFSGNTYFRKPTDSKISFTAESISMAVGKTYVFESTQTYIFGDIIANGACEGTIDISGSDSDAATFQAKSGVANIEVSSVNLLNVHANPVNVFEAKKSLNLGNTNGWKFEDEPGGRDLYWVNGEGYWDDPNHWATSSGAAASGGIADGCVPTAKDNVFFDGSSFDGFDQKVFTGSGDIRCRTMDWTGSESARPIFTMGDTDISGVYIYGSLIFNNQMEVDLSPLINFYFRATEAQSINTFDYIFPNIVEFDGKDGLWTLNSEFQTEGDLFIRHGKLIANGNLIECKSLTSIETPAGINSRGIDITNSNLIINGSEDVSGRSLYINLANEAYDQGFELIADNSTITLKDNADLILLGALGNSIVFNNITFEKGGELNSGFSGLDVYVSHLLFQGNGSINGKKNSFGTLELERGYEYKLEKKRTITTDFLLVEGSCFAPIYLHSSGDGSGNEAIIIAKNNVTGNFLEIKDIHADISGGIEYKATNSFDLGNTNGWIIDGAIAPIALYWTGNGDDDNWNNHENWSRAIDGSEEGCVPTLNDDVFFTKNSFFASKLVEIKTDAQCHSMTWYEDIDPDASFSVHAKLQMAGSMDLTESMSIDMQGVFEFVGDGLAGDKPVDFANKTMNGDIRFIGTNQSWVWQTGFVTSGNLEIEEGSVSTQGFDFTINQLKSLSLHNTDAIRSFNMTNSLVTVSSDAITSWYMKMNTTGGLNFTSTDSKITFENGGGIVCETDGDVHFGSVDFVKNGVINIKSALNTEHGFFSSVLFMEEGKIFGTNDFSNLEFTLGYEKNSIESGKTVTVVNDLKMEGVRCSYVFLKASESGVPATIHKPSGVFNKIYNASFSDINGTSGSGQPHPVRYKYDNNGSSTGFYELAEDTDGDGTDDTDPPSFEESFERQEWCSNIAVIDNVKRFPINSSTSFQWYFSTDGTAGTYTILNDKNDAVIEVTESGFYKVIVNYAFNTGVDAECNIEAVVEVLLGEVSKVSLEITSDNVKCFGESSGKIIAKVADEAQYPDYTFRWKDESGNEMTSPSTDKTTWESKALGLAPGKYYINVADSKNCEFDTIVNVFDAYKLLIDKIDTKDLECYTNPKGEISVTASGGAGDLSYYLDGNLQISETITGLYSGDYKIFVQDENNCKTTERDVTLNSNPEMIIDLNGLDLKCYGDKNGEFKPIISGGVSDYSFSWIGPEGYASTNSTISGLAGGLYKLTVTDNVGCIALAEQELNEPAELIADELVVESATCHGENTGELFVVGGQGTPNYRYFLDGVEESTGIFKSLAPENYVLRIVDAHGCIFEKDITVKEPNKIGFIVADIVLPSCEKTEDGVIRITPYGGNEGYSYSWTGPNDYKAYQQNIEKLVSGKYALNITDKKNCSAIDTVDLNLGLTLQLGVVVEQHVRTAGVNEGELAIELFEGTMPYTFTVTGPSGTFNSPDSFDENYYLIDNLAAGVYTVIATDASSCTNIKKSVIIESPGQIYTYINQIKPIGCVGFSDGELEAVVAGGSGTYTYSWTGPSGFSASGQKISGLEPGTYSLTASDGGNTANATFELLPADPILVSVDDFKNVSCYQAANGEIELSVDAGNSDYSIEWTKDSGTGFFSSAKKIMNLEPALYTYKVTTVDGCYVTSDQLITEPSIMSLDVLPTDISKEGERDGEVTANFGGGTAPYTVLISGPNGYSNSDLNNTSGTIVVGGLEMGIYEVAVIDANGCRIEKNTKIHEPTKLLVSTKSVTHIKCPDGKEGAITIEVEGASDPANLTFNWIGDNYFRSNDQNISDLSAGTYKLNVHDSGGDPGYEEQTLVVKINEPKQFDIEVFTKNISCPDMNDGYINIQAKGGTPGYIYTWTGAGVVNDSEDQKNLALGTYTVNITDVNGCKSKPIDIEIIEPKRLSVVVSGSKDPTCYGLENGWIQLDISAGTEPYIIDWDNYGSVTQRIEELTLGVYDYTVTDDNGCSSNGSVTLNQPDTLIAVINDFTDVLCHGDGSGRAFVDISGGTPDYTILWSDGQDTQEATDLKLGVYEVSVVDDQGCTDKANVEIFEPEPLAIEIEVIRPTTYDAMDGALAVSVTGGVTDYVYNWVNDESVLDNSSQLGGLDRGNYDLHLVDANNCPLDTTIVVEYLFERRIRIPKAFTPNYDGYNDYWDIERIEFIQNLKIVIYDRWGKAVYKFSGTGNEYKGEPWKGYDGTVKLPIGSYYYAVEVDDEKPIMGTVTILR